MTFSDLTDGVSVFVDANPLVYHFDSHPIFGLACAGLLARIERGDLRGFTSTHVLSEMAHRLMSLEACAVYGWPFPGIAARLKRHPAEIRALSRFRQAVDETSQFGLQILTISSALVA